ncbi:MAG: hypothetical protein WC483_00155 [Candidatus Paceibacterota bacterium]
MAWHGSSASSPSFSSFALFFLFFLSFLLSSSFALSFLPSALANLFVGKMSSAKVKVRDGYDEMSIVTMTAPPDRDVERRLDQLSDALINRDTYWLIHGFVEKRIVKSFSIERISSVFVHSRMFDAVVTLMRRQDERMLTYIFCQIKLLPYAAKHLLSLLSYRTMLPTKEINARLRALIVRGIDIETNPFSPEAISLARGKRSLLDTKMGALLRNLLGVAQQSAPAPSAWEGTL